MILDRFAHRLHAILLFTLLGLAGCSTLAPPPPSTSAKPSGRFDVPSGGLIRLPNGMSRDQAVSEVTSRSVLLLGTPYKLGGSHPSEGLDCSGLISHVMADAFKIRFPRTTEEQATVGVEISRRELAPGDLVFFNTTGRANSHVGVYLGERRFVHAPTARGVVRIESLDQGYWAKRFDQARRVIAMN
jgi:NlpC/P60 family